MNDLDAERDAKRGAEREDEIPSQNALRASEKPPVESYDMVCYNGAWMLNTGENCLQLCVCHLFGVHQKSVPDFYDGPPLKWFNRLKVWSKRFKVHPFVLALDISETEYLEFDYIGIWTVKNDDGTPAESGGSTMTHAVVMNKNNITFDPMFMDEHLGELTHAILFTPLKFEDLVQNR